MSPIPELNPEQKFYSHLVNCNKCKNAVPKGSSIKFLTKLREVLCPVGQKLLDNSLKFELKNQFKMTSFPFVPRMYQDVMALIHGKWVKGKVIDKSIGGNGRPVGYEIEVARPPILGLKMQNESFYVNQNNIKRLGQEKPLIEKQQVTIDKITITLGGM